MGTMNVHEKYMDDTIRAIENIIRYKYTSIITVKKIRNIYRIKPKDSSKINFFWRSLQSLEKIGILKRFGSKNPIKYQVLNYFKFFELFYDAYVNSHK
jgi:hypothetical protein